jgi:hypothetical protein
MTSDKRTFLAIVLGAIVVALVLAAYSMYGHKGESTVIDHPAIPAKPMVAAPNPMAPAAPAPAAPAAPSTYP